MIVGQDWDDKRYFTNNRGREVERNRPMKPCVGCLRQLGSHPGAGIVF
jgi:hypothetical protein